MEIASSSYNLIILHKNRQDWVGKLVSSLSEYLNRLLIDENLLMYYYNEIHNINDDFPSIAIFFGENDQNFDNLISLIDQIKNMNITVIPVVASEFNTSEQLPDNLKSIHAFKINHNSDWNSLSFLVLNELELTDKDRRVFISYRRSDGLLLANQLFNSLTEKGFSVFLDRFSIIPGQDFQSELEKNIISKSFILVIESPQAYESKWIRKEVNIGIKNHLGIFVVSWEDLENYIGSLHGFPKRTLTSYELVDNGNYKVTNEEVLYEICQEIETWHANAIRRRKRYLLDSIWKILENDYKFTNLYDKVVLIEPFDQAKSKIIIKITPRDPSISDIYELLSSKYNSFKVEPKNKYIIHFNVESPTDYFKQITWLIEKLELKNFSIDSIEKYM